MPAPASSPRRRAVYRLVFEARTPAGRTFDLLLIAAIVTSVAVIMLESVPGIREAHGTTLRGIEWFFTLAFTVEYLIRLSVVARPREYARSFFGVIDLLAILPTYASLVVPGAQAFLMIRLIRILRIFHVFELKRAQRAGAILVSALRESRHLLAVFLTGLAALAILLGALLYLVEGGPDSQFTSIPVGVYWAVVTITTLGYGDIVPVTTLGRGITTGIVILGYGVIAVPVGIISAGIVNAMRLVDPVGERVCTECGLNAHEPDASFCRRCGVRLPSGPSTPSMGPPG